jgi:diguanylate cyclase (GGDEF)-like protein
VSLQRRLTLIFILIVILPLAAAGLIVHRLVVGEVERRALLALTAALDSATLVFNDRLEVIEERVRAAVGEPRFARLLERAEATTLEGFLSRRVAAHPGIDFLVALDRTGDVLASIRRPPEYSGGFEPPGDPALADALPGPGPGYVSSGRIPVRVDRRRTVGWIVGGFWLDRAFLSELHGQAQLSVVYGEQVIATTAPLPSPAPIGVITGQVFEVDLGGPSYAEARPVGGGMALVASTPRSPIGSLSRQVLVSVALVLLFATGGTIALAYALARFLTQPLEELAQGARELARGRFDHRIPVRSRDEVGQLAAAFNDMADRLKQTIGQLSASRDQLQKAIRRVGDTLQATHDMKQLLGSILNTTVEATGADVGILWRFTPTRDQLYPAQTAGVLPRPMGRLAVGEGIVGTVAEHGRTLMLPADDAPGPAAGEPDFGVAIAVPLYSQNRVLGVISLYRRSLTSRFSDKDLDTAVFLAEQAGVAIENVLLHEEAQRLSLTDGLTGVWNRRFFHMQFKTVAATATRFGRRFSLLMMDLDHFKRVNDTYGHQAGDEMLIEFSRRASSILREVDTLARYGGEEFVCLLSETDVDGALIVAEKILHEVRAKPFIVGQTPIAATVSIGVACFPEHGSDLTALVAAADRALYRAKEQGRDRVRLPEETAPERLS